MLSRQTRLRIFLHQTFLIRRIRQIQIAIGTRDRLSRHSIQCVPRRRIAEDFIRRYASRKSRYCQTADE